MTRTSIRHTLIPGAAALALGISLTGCAASNETAAADSEAASSASAGNLTGELNGAGASSQEKAMEAWGTGFQGLNPDVTLNYNPVGSGDGRTQFIQGGTLFAGTDSYFSDDEGELTAATERCGGEDIIEVPAYVSPIAVVFNLAGVESLNLDADTMAKIFDRSIESWDDPAIIKQNPDVDLPDLAITTVHRQDDSGTTKNFTDYLAQASTSWPYDADDAFPVNGGVAAEGTSGVVAAVTNGKGTIGYADESQVGALPVVHVLVGDKHVAPSAEGAATTMAVSPAAEGRADTDLARDVDRTTTEPGAYPIILASYVVACQSYETGQEAALVKGFLTYVLSEEGQQAAADNAGSAPLETELADTARAIVAEIAAR